ncbi:MAG: hypothetical protein CSB47_10395 [Proteobacteria bacterium]|nr:MAG: hypothetical protein CSB47_10395 [Pseudomonadota bacterium]
MKGLKQKIAVGVLVLADVMLSVSWATSSNGRNERHIHQCSKSETSPTVIMAPVVSRAVVAIEWFKYYPYAERPNITYVMNADGSSYFYVKAVWVDFRKGVKKLSRCVFTGPNGTVLNK